MQTRSGRTLLARVSRLRNIKRAWAHLNRGNPGSSGVDDQTIAQFQENLTSNLASISDRLAAGVYTFSALKAAQIDKKSGGKRPLQVPTVSDRVAFRAILEIVDRLPHTRRFRNSRYSFAYIRGRPAKALVNRVLELMGRYAWVVETDIIKYFDRIDQDKLSGQLALMLPDDSLTALLKDALRAELKFPSWV